VGFGDCYTRVYGSHLQWYMSAFIFTLLLTKWLFRFEGFEDSHGYLDLRDLRILK
jgi:hypothetical protein